MSRALKWLGGPGTRHGLAGCAGRFGRRFRDRTVPGPYISASVTLYHEARSADPGRDGPIGIR
jgi:hypothetical protein